PAGQRLCLGPLHVGVEAAQPEQTRPGAVLIPHRHAPRGRAGSNGQVSWFRIGHGGPSIAARVWPQPGHNGKQGFAHATTGWGTFVSVDEGPGRMLARRLPGATVLQIVPSLSDQPEARAAVNVASALLRSGARAMIAGSPGMLVGQLQALGGE